VSLDSEARRRHGLGFCLGCYAAPHFKHATVTRAVRLSILNSTSFCPNEIPIRFSACCLSMFAVLALPGTEY
jgi:hypothetical protein